MKIWSVRVSGGLACSMTILKSGRINWTRLRRVACCLQHSQLRTGWDRALRKGTLCVGLVFMDFIISYVLKGQLNMKKIVDERLQAERAGKLKNIQF